MNTECVSAVGSGAHAPRVTRTLRDTRRRVSRKVRERPGAWWWGPDPHARGSIAQLRRRGQKIEPFLDHSFVHSIVGSSDEMIKPNH